MTELRKEFMGKERTDYMVGIEVEKTLAYKKKTLFVQGFKSADEIKDKCPTDIDHIYLCANRSFSPDFDWDTVISSLLDGNFYVTMDYPVAYHKRVMSDLSSKVWKHKNFIPMVTVDIVDLCGLSENLTVKVDDLEFVSKGVWCLNYKDIAQTSKFTEWNEYADDETI